MRFCNSRIPMELLSIGRLLNKPLPIEESRRQDVRHQKPKRCSVKVNIMKIRKFRAINAKDRYVETVKTVHQKL
nr:unnamed protein product [Callosobruchus chinensis]